MRMPFRAWLAPASCSQLQTCGGNRIWNCLGPIPLHHVNTRTGYGIQVGLPRAGARQPLLSNRDTRPFPPGPSRRDPPCGAQVLLQAQFAGRVDFVYWESPAAAAAAAAAGANHTRSMRGRRVRLGDVLPAVAGLRELDGEWLRRELGGVLAVRGRGHSKLQELGVCPPGPPAQWGKGAGGAWEAAWSGNAGRPGALVLLRA